MTKKFITGLALAAMLPFAASAATVEELQAQINALMAQLAGALPASSASCNYVFTKTLKAGMSDAEVMNLQKALNADVATQVAAMGVGSSGNETMYFGPATKAAVIKFQEKHASEVLYPSGLSAGTGLVGAATRAKLNALCSKTTGTPGTTTGGTTSTTGLQGGAGSINTTIYTSDVDDNMVTGEAKNILGFKIQADGSDVNISHLKLQVKTNSGTNVNASNILTRYFEKFDVYMGDEKVGTVMASDFTRDASGDYSKTFMLSKAVVKMGASNKATFYVKATGVDSMDSANAGSSNGLWDIFLKELRYTDATGVTLSNSPTTITETAIYVNKLASSSDVKVKISTGASNPEEKVVFVSDDSSGDKVTLLEFRIKAEGTDVSFDQFKATVTPTNVILGNAVTEFQLVKGTEVIDTVDGSATAYSTAGAKLVTFELDNMSTVARDATETYKVVARMAKIITSTTTATGFENGDILQADFASINGQDKNGDVIGSSKYTGSATGKGQTFRATGLNFVKISSTNTVNANNTTASSSYAEYKMQVRVTASGEDIWVPLTIGAASSTAGMSYSVLNSDGAGTGIGTPTASITHITGGTRDGAYVKVADGESATFETVVTVDPTVAGQYRLQINAIGYNVTGASGAATAQISGTPVQDYQSSLSYIQN